MKFERISQLISKYVMKSVTDGELAELERWLEEDPANRETFDRIMSRNWFVEKLEKWNMPDPEKAAESMQERIDANVV